MGKRRCSELLFGEQLINECEQAVKDEMFSELTLSQYQTLPLEEKHRLHNRVRQWALKAWQTLLNKHGLFCLVVGHLLRNAHRYFEMEGPSELQRHTSQGQNNHDISRDQMISEMKEANKKLCVINNLKGRNRIEEQQKMVGALREDYHSLQNMSHLSGILVKSIQKWCAVPKKEVNKSTQPSELCKKEFERFLIQDTISFAHPSKNLWESSFFMIP